MFVRHLSTTVLPSLLPVVKKMRSFDDLISMATRASSRKRGLSKTSSSERDETILAGNFNQESKVAAQKFSVILINLV